MKKTINIKSFFVTISLLLLFIFEILQSDSIYLKYLDEFLCIIFSIGTIFGILKKKSIDSKDRKLIFYFIFLIIICLISSIFSDLNRKWFLMIVDLIGILKFFSTYLFFKIYLKVFNALTISKKLRFISKILIIVATFFGIVSLFYDINMGGEIRFGIRGFYFIFHHQHILAIILLSSLTFIMTAEKNKKNTNFYILLVCICQILTTKGPSLIWVALIILFNIYFIKRKELNISSIILICLISILLGQYQIKEYFLNDSAPRALLYRYGFITANNYFPLGAGLASYGGECAKKDYSPLYVKYGFSNKWGMSKEMGQFLNDNYWPMIMAQFGYVGLLFVLIMFYLIFKNIQNIKNKRLKALTVCNFIYIMIHSLGSASLTGSEGMILVMSITIAEITGKVVSYEENN